MSSKSPSLSDHINSYALVDFDGCFVSSNCLLSFSLACSFAGVERKVRTGAQWQCLLSEDEVLSSTPPAQHTHTHNSKGSNKIKLVNFFLLIFLIENSCFTFHHTQFANKLKGHSCFICSLIELKAIKGSNSGGGGINTNLFTKTEEVHHLEN